MSEQDNEIVLALDDLLNGNYSQQISVQGEIGAKIDQLRKKLQVQGEADLSRVVALSVESNETAIFSAQLLHSLRNVDEKAQVIAAAGEEMTATVKEIGSYGENISRQAKEVQQVTHEGAEASLDAKGRMQIITQSVQESAERVNKLDELSNSISDILGSIRKIASQTNLLALNATIEAARAGEAGRGFAVVASEVKNLSTQTAGATEEIASIIDKLQAEMQGILGSMDRSSEAVGKGEETIEQLNDKMGVIRTNIDEMTENATHIAETLQQQAEASNEVAEGIASIARSSSQSVEGIDRIVDSMDKVEQMISAQIAVLAELDVPAKVVKLAQSDHVIWKKRLASMIAGREGLNPDELADHHACRLGKWYDKQTDPRYTQNPDFIALIEPHQEVHARGIEAVRLYNAGKVSDALAEIERVEAASRRVLELLAKLEKVEANR